MSAVSARGRALSWALYDWANSAFATTVMAGFFPLFFKQYWSAGADVTRSTFHLGVANSAASLTIVLLAPLLGAIADRTSGKKRFLAFFAGLGIVMSGLLYVVDMGEWRLAAVIYVLGTIGFSGSLIFYDALILGVCAEERLDAVSALGFALGYLGGGILFAVNVLMTLNPGWFGLADAGEAVRLSFLSVALWWAVFAIPLFLFVDEPRIYSAPLGWRGITAGFRQLRETFARVRRLRVVFTFLLGYWLYIDGVDTIVRMAVDFGLSIGFESNDLIVALLITQFVGFPAALVFGWLGGRIGAKRGIVIAVSVYLGVVVWGYTMDTVAEFYGLAVAVGLVQGGVQSLSRSFYARIIPRDKAAEFFGFYNMLGKFAAVIGPVLMGWVSVASGSPRLSILALAILFIGGLFFLLRADEAEGRRMARAMEEGTPQSPAAGGLH